MAKVVGYCIGWGDIVETIAGHFSPAGNGTYVGTEYYVNGRPVPDYVEEWLDSHRDWWWKSKDLELVYSNDGDYRRRKMHQTLFIPIPA